MSKGGIKYLKCGALCLFANKGALCYLTVRIARLRFVLKHLQALVKCKFHDASKLLYNFAVILLMELKDAGSLG
jgi:hypothetical protein